jgi:hypothetical protein
LDLVLAGHPSKNIAADLRTTGASLTAALRISNSVGRTAKSTGCPHSPLI